MTFYSPLPLSRNLTLSAGGGDEALEKFSISSLSAVPAGLLISILATEKKMLILSLFT